MYKLLFLALIVIALALYFTGALEVDTSGDSVNLSVDKEKAIELGESVKDKIEE